MGFNTATYGKLICGRVILQLGVEVNPKYYISSVGSIEYFHDRVVSCSIYCISSSPLEHVLYLTVYRNNDQRSGMSGI